MAAHLKRSGLPKLAQKLKSCTTGHRCGSGACPNCLTATGRFLSEQIRIAFPPPAEQLKVTIVPSDESLLASKIAAVGIRDHRAVLRDGLANAGLSGVPVIGGFDISYDRYRGTISKDAWVGHWCLFFADCDRGELFKALKTSFPRTLLVPKPIMVLPVTYTPDVAHWYAFANSFDEKQIIVNERRRQTNSKTVTKQHAEFNALLLWLDRTGLTSRIYMQGGRAMV
ncbi:MAG: hypothetical protein ACREHF_13680 [Rhizomicrobium sp.]